ncbi:MAG: UDP-3-O-(3-hydroxymyristoyl)glucosamine N-acyltransferase [Helicobacteraceae bacterium 4484_230]|nr:MAG: UDP-3-O-(3-hydroxymyristoyl)glucosamine N-acyltransferase [Helicobacteraceae bacterium 4484_230]
MVTLEELTDIAGVRYDGVSIDISGLNTLRDAKKGEVSFLENKKYVNDLLSTHASAVFVSPDMAVHVPKDIIALVDEEPYLKLALASKLFAPPVMEDEGAAEPQVGEGTEIAAGAMVCRGSIIGKNCYILPGAYIGPNAVIGDNTIIYANATVYRDCVVGSNCMIHSGAVVGSDGFGFATTRTGTHVKIYQNGNVVIEDDVEIGSNSTVDRAAFGSTLIKQGVRIDNLVQIGHNCVVGEYSVLVSQSGLAGSTELGRNVVMGGQSAAAGHLKIAPFTQFAARAGITNDVKESHKVYGGFPLMEQRSWLKLQAKLARILKGKS